MDGDDVAEMSDEEYLKVFLEWMHRTRAKLRRRYGDRIVDIMGFDDFLQEAAISIWRNRADPKYMGRKADLQQKTFFQRRFYRRTQTILISMFGDLNDNRGQNSLQETMLEDKSEEPFTVDADDWEKLRKRFSLRDMDIVMLQMRCNGSSAEEISLVTGIAPNSVHVRISDIKRRIMESDMKGDL